MELELRKALPLKQFHLYYQPQFTLGSDTICGFEALIRWVHPERGLVSPGDFIPLAEEIGLTAPIGTWVLNEACQQAAFWPSSISIAVNISPIQFLDGGFLPSVQAALEATGLLPERLEIEVTENVLFGDEDEAAKVMHAIRDMGVRLAIDDFGTGYSSLHYLRKFPFTKIKIAQSFVRVSGDDSIAHEIVNAIAALGKAFGMDTIAEGVETSDQLEQIRARGCQAVQGFLVSRPLPIAEANAYLETKLGTSGRNAVKKKYAESETMSENLFRLIYCSRNAIAGDRTTVRSEIDRILEASRRNNPAEGITGVLIFNEGFFGQVLEGPLDRIEARFERIQCDHRHSNPVVLDIKPIDARGFPNWSMGFLGISKSAGQMFSHVAQQSEFEYARLDGDELYEMLKRLAREQEASALEPA